MVSWAEALAEETADRPPEVERSSDDHYMLDTGRTTGLPRVGLFARRGHIPLGHWHDEEKTASTLLSRRLSR